MSLSHTRSFTHSLRLSHWLLSRLLRSGLQPHSYPCRTPRSHHHLSLLSPQRVGAGCARGGGSALDWVPGSTGGLRWIFHRLFQKQKSWYELLFFFSYALLFSLSLNFILPLTQSLCGCVYVRVCMAYVRESLFALHVTTEDHTQRTDHPRRPRPCSCRTHLSLSAAALLIFIVLLHHRCFCLWCWSWSCECVFERPGHAAAALGPQ